MQPCLWEREDHCRPLAAVVVAAAVAVVVLEVVAGDLFVDFAMAAASSVVAQRVVVVEAAVAVVVAAAVAVVVVLEFVSAVVRQLMREESFAKEAHLGWSIRECKWNISIHTANKTRTNCKSFLRLRHI